MCMKVGISGPTFAILAADTRWTYTAPVRRIEDRGGKVRRMAGGWVATSGKIPLLLKALPLLERQDAADTHAVRDLLERKHHEIQRSYPDLRARGTEGSLFLVAATAATPYTLHALDGAGRDFAPGGVDKGFGAPPPEAVGGRWDARWKRFVSEAQDPDTLERKIALMGGLFSEMAVLGDSMSDEIEVGLTVAGKGSFHLRAPADVVAEAGPEEIGDLLNPVRERIHA